MTTTDASDSVAPARIPPSLLELSEVLADGPGKRVQAASAAAVQSLRPGPICAHTRHQAVRLTVSGLRSILRSSTASSYQRPQSSDASVSTQARSAVALLQLQEAALRAAPDGLAFSQLDTADAVQTWSDAYNYAVLDVKQDANEKSLASVKQATRARIVSCISAWCATCPRSLFAHLALLMGKYDPTHSLSSHRTIMGELSRTIDRARPPKPRFGLLAMSLNDPALSVQLSAIECVRQLLLAAHVGKYLQIAEEPKLPARAYAFTSLSAKVAALVVSVRAAVTTGIEKTVSGPAKLSLGFLDVAEMLVTKANVRLRVPHSSVLTPALTTAAEQAIPVVAIRAWELLKVCGVKPEPPTIPPHLLNEALDALQCSPSTAAAGGSIDNGNEWTFLTVAAGMNTVWSLEQQRRLLQCIEAAGPDSRALRALHATLLHSWPFSQASNARLALGAIQHCIPHDAPSESQLLAGRCAAILLATYLVDTEKMVDCLRSFGDTSRELSVRVGTLHALGAGVQTLLSNCSSPLTPTVKRVLQTLWACIWSYVSEIHGLATQRPHPSDEAKANNLELAAQITWVMANLLEAPLDVNPSQLSLATSWISLPERVGTNAVRATGSLLAHLSAETLPSSHVVVGNVVRSWAQAVSSRTPKMRWNAAAAAQRALSAHGPYFQMQTGEVLLSLRDLRKALEANLSTVSRGNWKVLRASATALRAMPSNAWHDAPERIATLEVVQTALQRMASDPKGSGNIHATAAALDELQSSLVQLQRG